MKQRFPMLCNYLIFEPSETDWFSVRNSVTEEDLYEVSHELAQFMQQLDGKTDPYAIPTALSRSEIAEQLDWLEKNQLLRHSAFVESTMPIVHHLSIHTFCYTASERWNRIATWIHRLVRFGWLPITIAGIVLASVCKSVWVGKGTLLSSLVSLLFCIVLFSVVQATTANVSSQVKCTLFRQQMHTFSRPVFSL